MAEMSLSSHRLSRALARARDTAVRDQRGQGTVEYVGVVAVVVLVVAVLVATVTPVGDTIQDSMACAVQDVGTTQDGDPACDPAEAGAGDGEDTGGLVDDEDEPVIDLPGGGVPYTGLRCLPEWDFCQPEEPADGTVPVCVFPLGTLGCGVQEISEDDLPPYDPEDDCTTDDSCEDVWEGALEPDEAEGDIEQVPWLECNFNILGWYPNDHVRFSWEANSLSGAGAANPSVCVDGTGTINIDQEGVERFDAGGHTGWFIYKGDDGYEYKHYFEENETSYFDPSSTIYEVHID
ncbi:hypothetical protein [Promicromonospora sp. NPDC050880]|uniref:hypothetical protein n=1 Tax=Promicromonospora sp. NPDC050880 TaxID=3364406 RepID=UPI00378E02C0